MDDQVYAQYPTKLEHTDSSLSAPPVYASPVSASNLTQSSQQYQWQSAPSDYQYNYASYSSVNSGNEQHLYHSRQPEPTMHDPSMIPPSNSTVPPPAPYYPPTPNSAYPQQQSTSVSPQTFPQHPAPVSRPSSIVHAHSTENFSRARSTSYSGPYFFPPGLNSTGEYVQNGYHSSTAVRIPESATPTPKAQNTGAYYGAYGYQTVQEEAPNMPRQMSVTSNGFHPSNSTYAYTPQPVQQLSQALPTPLLPLTTAISSTSNATIPRSMSMGSIPMPGTHSSSFGPSSYGSIAPPFGANSSTPFSGSGRTTPSGVLTPGSASAYPTHARPPRSRLGMPSLTIPTTNMYMESAAQQEQEYLYGSAAPSPSTPGRAVLSSMNYLKGTASGPGTASNGGSVPLTPTTTTEGTEYDAYHHITAGLSRLGHMSSNQENDVEEEDEDEDGDSPMLSIPSRMLSTSGAGSAGNSPRRATASGVKRTDRKRISVTLGLGPAAQPGSRSRSGTLVGGLTSLTPITNPINGSLAMSPIDALAGGFGESARSSISSANGSVNGSNLSNGNASGAAAVIGGQANSPLAMKELSPSIKPVIDDYLLRYLNHLCVNPNAKDRMGHQIHQMYTARRIQRYEQLYGWRPLKFRIEAFVNGFVDLLTARGLSQDITMKIPHYLNNSKLFSRFNESGNRMKSQGQTIWRVRARCRTDIPGVDGPAAAAAAAAQAAQAAQVAAATQHPHHPHPSAFPQHSQTVTDDANATGGLMLSPDPLVWEFLPYERCIVGQPPLAIVGTAWQWNMKVHDHWTPRKKITWSFSTTTSSPAPSSNHDGELSSSPSVSGSSSTSNTLPKWLSLHGSKLKGTPTHPGEYPISVEATFQEDNDPEPVVVRGQFKIQVSKAITGWKNKASVAQEGLVDSPPLPMEGDGHHEGSNLSGGSVRGTAPGGASDSMGMGPGPTMLFAERMNYGELYGQPQGQHTRPPLVHSYSYPYAYVH